MSFENAVNIYTKENAPRVSLDGKLVYVYSAGYVYDVAMGVKHHDPEAIKEMATELSKMIDEDCFLVPAPQHTGKAEYTLEICKIIERINKEVYLLHYICKSPMFFVSERDVVDKRYDFYEGDVYYDFSSSTKDDLIPSDENIVRITDHCSVCKIFEDNEGFNIISITQVDTKVSLPPAVINSQLPSRYKSWYDALVNEINNDESK
jgi:hypothetical protein